jgi:glycosyltransferase involved in cell wall biosynthesis
VGGIVDYVEPGRNGLLFDAGDVTGLARSLSEALAHPEFGRGRVEVDCFERMRVYLSPEEMAARFLDAYRSVVPGCAVRPSADGTR